jgi:hypothetical protein
MSLCYVVPTSTKKPSGEGEGFRGRLEKADTLLASPPKEKP